MDDNDTLKELIEIEEDSNNIKELKKSISLNKINLEKVENKIRELMIDKDPNDEKDVIVEIQGAAGGDESKIFVGDLFRAYQKYFSKMDFTIELIEDNESESGGYSNISFYVRG